MVQFSSDCVGGVMNYNCSVIVFSVSVNYENKLPIFSPLSKLAGRAIYFACVNFFFFLTWDKLSQDLLDRFSRSFHQMKGICVNFLDPDFFFDSFRDVAMATDFGQNLQSDLHSALWHFNMNNQVNSANDPSTSCTNMVNFGPVTPEIEVWEICTFQMIRQKSAYLTEYLNNYWSELHQHFSFGKDTVSYTHLTLPTIYSV